MNKAGRRIKILVLELVSISCWEHHYVCVNICEPIMETEGEIQSRIRMHPIRLEKTLAINILLEFGLGWNQRREAQFFIQ